MHSYSTWLICWIGCAYQYGCRSSNVDSCVNLCGLLGSIQTALELILTIEAEWSVSKVEFFSYVITGLCADTIPAPWICGCICGIQARTGLFGKVRWTSQSDCGIYNVSTVQDLSYVLSWINTTLVYIWAVSAQRKICEIELFNDIVARICAITYPILSIGDSNQ